MKQKFDNILETIGDTPVVNTRKLAPEHVNLLVKLEARNPGGSVKDRLALVGEIRSALHALVSSPTIPQILYRPRISRGMHRSF